MSDLLPPSLQPGITTIRRWSAERDHWAMVLVTGIYIFSILIHFNIPKTELGMYNLAIPLLALGILGLYRDLLLDVWRYHRRTLLLTIALYFWLWVSAFFGGHTATAIKYTIKYSIYFFVFPALLTLSFEFVRDRKSDWVYQFLWLFTLVAAGFGIVDYFHPQSSLLTWIRFANPYNGARLMSFFDNPNKLGFMMAFGVINVYVMGKLKILKNPVVIALSTGLCGTIGILSGSRNFFVAIILTMLLGIYPWKILGKREILVTLVVAGGLTALMLGITPTVGTRLIKMAQDVPHNWELVQQMMAGDQETITALSTPARLRIWYTAGQQFQQSPVTGTGLAGFTNDIMDHLNAHNLLLTLLVELGIPGIVLFLGVIVSALWQTQLYSPQVGFFCSFIFTAQLVDFFIHDFAATTTLIWLVAAASQMRGGSGARAPLPLRDL